MSAPISTTPFAIPVRRDLSFEFVATPAIHSAGNPVTSHFWNALSLLAPYTEAFLIRAMKRSREEVSDPELLEQVDSFLAQEALHTRQHNLLNARLGELGYDIKAVGDAIAVELRKLTDKNDARSALALVIAGEYVIYAISRAVLEEPALLADTAPEVRRLMEWHALEEMEHQSVACDVYRHLYGEGLQHRLLHFGALVKACRVLAVALRRAESILMRGEPRPSSDERRAHARYMLRTPGLLWKVVARLPGFFAPGFKHWADPHDRTLIERAEERVYAGTDQVSAEAC
jgi:predicted metal-dependent hydrolase